MLALVTGITGIGTNEHSSLALGAPFMAGLPHSSPSTGVDGHSLEGDVGVRLDPEPFLASNELNPLVNRM